jgi:hypothetical protein
MHAPPAAPARGTQAAGRRHCNTLRSRLLLVPACHRRRHHRTDRAAAPGSSCQRPRCTRRCGAHACWPIGAFSPCCDIKIASCICCLRSLWLLAVILWSDEQCCLGERDTRVQFVCNFVCVRVCRPHLLAAGLSTLLLLGHQALPHRLSQFLPPPASLQTTVWTAPTLVRTWTP